MAKSIVYGAVLSLLCTAHIASASNYGDESWEGRRTDLLMQDPLVQRAMKTGNPLVITLAAELRKRQRDGAKECKAQYISDSDRFCVLPEGVVRELQNVGLRHFAEKTDLMTKIAQQKKFSKKELNQIVDQETAAYIAYMAQGSSSAVINLVQEIMPQRKEHLLEILMRNARK